jgi:hypothetical protein
MQSKPIYIRSALIKAKAVPLHAVKAFGPSLTCHLPAPTIGCLHSNDSLTTMDFSRIPKYHSNMCLIVASVAMLLVTLLDDNEVSRLLLSRI